MVESDVDQKRATGYMEPGGYEREDAVVSREQSKSHTGRDRRASWSRYRSVKVEEVGEEVGSR